MTWWASNVIEPKRAYRWHAYINLFNTATNFAFAADFGPTYFTVTTFQKPTFVLESEKIINNFTSETEIATKNYTWDDISLTMVDAENQGGDNTAKLYFWLMSLGYKPVQTVDGMSSLFTNLYNQKMAIALQQLNADGQPIEKWTFVKPQPTRIQFGGDLDYGSDEILKVTMDITYVSADLQSLNA